MSCADQPSFFPGVLAAVRVDACMTFCIEVVMVELVLPNGVSIRNKAIKATSKFSRSLSIDIALR